MGRRMAVCFLVALIAFIAIGSATATCNAAWACTNCITPFTTTELSQVFTSNNKWNTSNLLWDSRLLASVTVPIWESVCSSYYMAVACVKLAGCSVSQPTTLTCAVSPPFMGNDWALASSVIGYACGTGKPAFERTLSCDISSIFNMANYESAVTPMAQCTASKASFSTCSNVDAYVTCMVPTSPVICSADFAAFAEGVLLTYLQSPTFLTTIAAVGTASGCSGALTASYLLPCTCAGAVGCFDCYTSTSVCSNVAPGYILYSGNGSCSPCAPNCFSCNVSGAGLCDVCDDGYGPANNAAATALGICTPMCAPNCTSCAISGPYLCDTCSPGFGQGSGTTTVCIPCSTGVSGCNQSCNTLYTQCSACNPAGPGATYGYAPTPATGTPVTACTPILSTTTTKAGATTKAGTGTTTPFTGSTTVFTGSTAAPGSTTQPGTGPGAKPKYIPQNSTSTTKGWNIPYVAPIPPILTLPKPVKYVIIHHTYADDPPCASTVACSQYLKLYQKQQMAPNGEFQLGLSNIAYNFLIGGDGNVYEGRGWGIQGQHVQVGGWNSKSIGVAMIGTYNGELPNANMLSALSWFLNVFGVGTGNLIPNYVIYSHRDLQCVLCPGGDLRDYLISNYPFNYALPAPQKCIIRTNPIHATKRKK